MDIPCQYLEESDPVLERSLLEGTGRGLAVVCRHHPRLPRLPTPAYARPPTPLPASQRYARVGARVLEAARVLRRGVGGMAARTHNRTTISI